MSRIINRQRQLGEQGRLRLGYTVPATKKDGSPTTRPVASETWVVTSHDQEKVQAAADLWGGDVEHWEPMGNGAKQWRVITEAKAIPAFLPPGDPLNQSYEQWNRGGCVRRCNGVTEELSGSPCICLAQFGDTWHEQGPRDVCGDKSRLKVLLSEMPGFGSWRMETGSYYAADEIAGIVDTLRAALGEQVIIPVTLRIEPRQRVAGGQTKNWLQPVVDVRGITAGALLSGQALEIGALVAGNPDSAKPLALQAREGEQKSDPFVPFFERVAATTVVDDLAGIWDEAKAAGLVGSTAADTPRAREFVAAWKARAHQLKPAATQPPVAPQPDADGVVDAELVGDGDADAIWQQVLLAGGKQGMTSPDIEDDFAAKMGGLSSAQASAAELKHYLGQLTGEQVPA